MNIRNKVALSLAFAWFVLCVVEVYLDVPAMPRHIRVVFLIVGLLFACGAGYFHNTKD